jgi:hypothetical protein
MKSRVADEVRRERVERELAMSPAERVALALQLGREAAEEYAAAHGMSVAEARRALAAARQKGRRRSKCAER